MIISIDAEKTFDNIQNLPLKTPQKAGIKGTYLNIVKAIYEKTTSNSIFNDEKQKAFPLKSGTRQGCPLSPQPSNIDLGVLATTDKEENEIKGIQVGKRKKKRKEKEKKERKKLSLFAEDMILYIESPKSTTRILLEVIDEYDSVAFYKLLHRSLLYCYT